MCRKGGCYAREECFENKLVRNSIFGCAAVAAFNEKFMNSEMHKNLFDFFKSPHTANINLQMCLKLKKKETTGHTHTENKKNTKKGREKNII